MSAEAADKTLPPTGKPRKKKKRAAPEAAEPALAAVDGVSAEDRPAFALGFPRDAELDRLVDAFEAGNYAEVRAGAQVLVHATQSDDVRRAARELLRRLEPDPIAVYMIVVAVALLGFLSFWYWTHPHGEP